MAGGSLYSLRQSTYSIMWNMRTVYTAGPKVVLPQQVCPEIPIKDTV